MCCFLWITVGVAFVLYWMDAISMRTARDVVQCVWRPLRLFLLAFLLTLVLQLLIPQAFRRLSFIDGD